MHRSRHQTIRESQAALIHSIVEMGATPAIVRQVVANQRYIMGIVSNVLAASLAVNADEQADKVKLQSQLATAQANALDANDLAAIQTAENDPAIAAKLAVLANALSGSQSNTSAGSAATLPGGAGSDSTANLSTGAVVTDPAAPKFVASAAGILTDAAGRTVYTYSGTGVPDPTQWPTAGSYTPGGGTAETVYYFAGDATAGSAAGVVAGTWATIPATPTAVAG